MIKKLTLKNFRRHEDLTIDFATGLNTLRGSNEAGKSTVIEGVLYALYGTKALRSPLAEAVTWGRKESELKVILVIDAGGYELTFTRSKGGAECTAKTEGQGVHKVTGQAEVTNYASQVLGADAKTASLLMLATQSGLRGALSDGPTAVSGLMSRLADFDLIDRIVAAAEEKLLLGSEVPLKAKLEQAKTDAAQIEVPDEKIHLDLEAQEKSLAVRVAELNANAELLTPKFKAAEDAYAKASEHNEHIVEMSRDLQNLNDRRGHLRTQAQAATQEAVRVPAEKLEAAQKAVQTAMLYDELTQAYNDIKILPVTDMIWDDDRASFDRELDAARTKQAQYMNLIAGHEAETRALSKQIVKEGGKCPTCGHVATSDEHVKKHNADIQDQIKALAQASAADRIQYNAATQEVNELLAVKKMADRYDQTRARVEGRGYPVEIDLKRVPCGITWTGGPPLPGDLPVARKALRDLQEVDNKAIQAQGRVQVLEGQIAVLGQQAKDLETRIFETKPIDLAPLRDEYSRIAQAVVAITDAQDKAKAELTEVTNKVQYGRWWYEVNKAKRDAALDRIAECEADLKKLAFNNVLIKKLKSLKPTITDHLWNSVLSAVSNFFSTLRGERSVVTKDGSGFRVNGQGIDSLSGSTLDVLALAIRVALTKTFIPHASFMVLDEPAAGCDNTRTSSLLGFLASVGFRQTLLASHDELSESVADKVIALEA